MKENLIKSLMIVNKARWDISKCCNKSHNNNTDGWIKLNTDGSCSDDGKIGCGGLLRGSDGE
jgi:hypothetical protein